MNIYDDNVTGQEKQTLELARIASAENGGPAIGSGSHIAQERQEQARKKRQAEQEALQALIRLATPDEIADCLADLQDLQSRLDQAFDDLEEWKSDMDARTLRLEDGTPVYLMADGQYCTSDNRIIPSHEIPDDIPADVLTFEEYQAYLRRVEQLARIQTDVINAGRETLESGKATAQDIEDIEAAIENADHILKTGLAHPESPAPNLDAPQAVQTANLLNVPTI